VAKDLDGTILAWNEGARRIYGYQPEEIIGKSGFLLHHPDDVKQGRAQAILDEARATGKWSGELRRVRKNGNVFDAMVSIMLRRNAKGDPVGFTMISHDLTESERVLSELKESQTYNRSLFESSIDALATTDPLGIITDVNRQMCEMTGYSREELIGSPGKLYFTDPRRCEDGIRLVLAQDRITNYELVIRSRNGSETPVSYNATTFRSSDGKLKGVFAAARDNTAQKRLDTQLRHKNEELENQYRRVRVANRLKSEFLVNMSHEVRTPLNSIIGFSELMHDEKVGPINDKQKEYISDVLTSGRHLLRLINDVLDLAKVESGKLEFLPEPIDPKELVSEVRDVLRAQLAHKRLHLDIKIAAELNEIVIDPSKLKQVLFNYLSNAIKFTPEEGCVTVAMRPEGADDFIIEVKDTGIGIKPEDIKLLFVEYQQLDATASKKYQGTGLGLALAKRIVEAQGGSVGVTSVFGKGSVFFARLPRKQTVKPSTTHAIVGSTASIAPGRRSVLVIEDNPSEQAWLASTLDGAGYEVVAAANGAEALRLLNTKKFDAVTLDLLLPDMSGWDIMRQIREGGLNRDVSVVIVTVLADEGMGARFAIHNFLEKPVSREALLNALERVAIHSGAKASVLLVQDNEEAVKLYETVLKKSGFETAAYSNPSQALQAASKKLPNVLVLDPAMPEIDGFEFMRRFRTIAGARNTPVILLTAKDLTKQALESLPAAALIVTHNGADSADALVAGIKSCFCAGESVTAALAPPVEVELVRTEQAFSSDQGLKR